MKAYPTNAKLKYKTWFVSICKTTRCIVQRKTMLCTPQNVVIPSEMKTQPELRVAGCGCARNSTHSSSKASILWCLAFFMVHPSHPYMSTGKTIALTLQTFVGKEMSLLFNMLSRFVIAFLPRSKRLLILWLQSTICDDFGAQANKVCHCFHFSPIYLPLSDGTGCHNLNFLNVEFYASFFALLFHPHQETFGFFFTFWH